MTTRELAIAKSILHYLHDLDGGQAHELTIHAGASVLFQVPIPMNEFREVFGQLNGLAAFRGVPTKFKGTLWSLSPEGEQIRLELAE